jgi:hypothetical protein
MLLRRMVMRNFRFCGRVSSMTVWNKLTIVLMKSLVVDCLARNSYNDCKGWMRVLSYLI